jgi:tRNA nucleotidyltransferase (CCA-adding enzyme)
MSDYNFLMESRLSPEQYKVLTYISRIAVEQGLNLYLVGGAVRDLTYGQQVVRDLDFAVEGNAQRIARRLESGSPTGSAPGGSLITSGEPVLVSVEHLRFDARLNSTELRFINGVRAEIAMCRQEVYMKPGQRPDIQPAMIFDDLKRRDFSVNAMAVSLHPNSRGLLLDPTNGAADIERQELRVLHSRSFMEDPVRLYRLLCLSLRLNFKPEERTKMYFETALESHVWDHLDPELQARELRAILYENNPARILKELAERKLLAGLDKKLATAQIPFERFAKVRAVVQGVPDADAFLLNFDCLVSKLGSAHKYRLAKKILAEKKTIQVALGMEREAKRLARVLGSPRVKLPSQVYALLAGQPLTLLLYLRATSAPATVQNRLKNFLFKYSPAHTRLPHAELQALGVKPGPLSEKILERIFLEQLDGKIKTPQQMLKRMRELAGIPEPPPKPAKPAAPPPKRARKAAATGKSPQKPSSPPVLRVAGPSVAGKKR